MASKKRWAVVIGVILLVPVLLVGAAVVSLGMRIRDADRRVSGLCEAFPVGKGATEAAVVQQAREAKVPASVRGSDEGKTTIEARDGAMTDVITCTIELQGGRVVRREVTRQD